MPLIDVTPETALSLLQQPYTTNFVVFLGSGTPSWCRDCRAAQPALEAVFGPKSAPTLHVVPLGNRDEWKSPQNPWRASPYHVDQTPTLVKLTEGKEVQRLGESECQSEKALRDIL